MTADRLAQLFAGVPSSARVIASGNAATPWTLLDMVDSILDTYVLHLLNPQPGVPDREGVVIETPFVGPGARGSSRLSYIPTRLSMVPLLYQNRLPPDVVLLHTSIPRAGTVSMGTEVNVLPAAVEAVRRRGGLVLAQHDPAMPHVLGDGVIPQEWVDFAIEATDPPGSPRQSVADEAAVGVADQVARRIPDGATLQLGIGGIPDAVLSALTRRRGLFAQVNASRVRGRPYSGFGGQTDFIVGALHAPRGQAIIALRSWHPRADVSTIVPMLDEPPTSFQPSAVVTEQGTADLWGRSDQEQAHQLIHEGAHPGTRDELTEEAQALGLLPL